ncbi:unnamed protein product [Caenorhabditis sp. 36 PRJEB53466]|nr:unnamed protein product [Caenorhabditis sp. 36 PRJEB53466]
MEHSGVLKDANEMETTLTTPSAHEPRDPAHQIRNVGYVLDPNALLPIHHHQQPPTYEDSIKSHSPPKYDMTPATTNSTTHNSMELPTSSATTARVDGRLGEVARGAPMLMHARSMSDSWLGPYGETEEEGRKSAR